MSTKSISSMDFIPKESNPFHYLKYIDFLQRESADEDYIEGVSTLMASLAKSSAIDFENRGLLIKTIQHCLNVSGKLFAQNQQSQALDILESARNLLSKHKNKDPALEKLRTILYNNLAAYCLSIEDSSMGISFLQNCLKKDNVTNNTMMCIFLNNLAGVYLTHAAYEKAFQLTKKSIYLIEPDIFAEIQQKPSRLLKEDEIFKKNLLVLLIGYLNMGSILEGYQFQTSIAEPSKEMYDMSPKDFYKNAYGLAKKFLGENHFLTNRLHYCYSKSELILFKGITTEGSEMERNTSPKRRLRNMLESIDDEDITKKAKHSRHGHFSQSYSAKSVHKNFLIRKNSLTKVPKLRQSMDSPDSSNDGYETPEDRAAVHHFNSGDFNRYQQPGYSHPEGFYPKPSVNRPQSGTYRAHNAYSPTPSFNNNSDQTQIFMQMMFQQQLRQLEDNFNRKIDELKNITKLTTIDSNENRGVDSKDDPKIKILEKELELLKEKMNHMKTAKELKRKSKAIGQEDGSPMVVNRYPETSRDFQSRSYTAEVKPAPPIIHNIAAFSDSKGKEGKESEQSTKSSGPENHFFLSPTKTPPAATLKTTIEKVNGFDQLNNTGLPEHNTTGLPGFDDSPISKNEKFFEPKPATVTKKKWVPGKYSDPQSRKFKLDLKKVENHKDTAEEMRGREDEKFEVAPPKLKDIGKEKNAQAVPTPAIEQTQTNTNPPPKLVKNTEKVPIKRTAVEKTLSVVSAGPASVIPKEEEAIKKASSQEKVEKEKFEKEKVEKEKANTSITPKGDPNDDSKTIGEEEKLGRSDNTTDRSKSLNQGYKRNSLSIPTSLDYMDSPTGSQFSSPSHVKLPKYALIRKRVFMRDDLQYMLICTASWTKEEKLFKLQLMGPEEKNQTEFTKVESELELPYKDLKKILKHLEYKDVMPVTFHIKQIKSFYTLVRYLLMPFTTIRALEDGKKEIAIYPKPPSLLTNSVDELPTIEFMGLQCVIIFTHVNRNTFRVILTDPEIVEDALRIDVDFDKTSFDFCFERHGGVDAPLRKVETSVKIIQGFDEDADNDEMNEFREINKKMSNQSRQDEEELESFKVIHKDLVEDLGNTLKEMEAYLMSHGIKKLSQVSDEKEVKYCKLKFTNKMQRATLHFVWDRPEKQILEVKIKNFFETFAPQGKKVRVCGESKFVYDSVWKHFGLNYPQLEYLDKLAVCSLVSEVYNIDFFERELNKEEFERYEENPISFVPIEIGAYHRTFLGEKYKFPLTLSLVGIKGEPRGIKAVIYNLEEALEVGAFFHINPSSWIIEEADKKKKKRSDKVNTISIIENYYLSRILKKCGWEILKNWLVLEKRPNRVDIVGIKIFKDIRHTEQIENVLNSDTILKHINDKDQVEA